MSSLCLGTTGMLEQDAWLLVQQVYGLCEAVRKRECRMAGISTSAFEVLSLVKSQPKPLTAYRVATLLGHQYPGVVEIVNRLRRKGLLERRVVNGKSSLEITGAGEKTLLRALSKLLLNRTIGSLGTERIEQLMEGLMPLRQAAMQEIGLDRSR